MHCDAGHVLTGDADDDDGDGDDDDDDGNGGDDDDDGNGGDDDDADGWHIVSSREDSWCRANDKLLTQTISHRMHCTVRRCTK